MSLTLSLLEAYDRELLQSAVAASRAAAAAAAAMAVSAASTPQTRRGRLTQQPTQPQQSATRSTSATSVSSLKKTTSQNTGREKGNVNKTSRSRAPAVVAPAVPPPTQPTVVATTPTSRFIKSVRFSQVDTVSEHPDEGIDGASPTISSMPPPDYRSLSSSPVGVKSALKRSVEDMEVDDVPPPPPEPYASTSEPSPSPRSPLAVPMAHQASIASGVVPLVTTKTTTHEEDLKAKWDRLMNRQRYHAMVAAIREAEAKQFEAECTFRPVRCAKSIALAKKKRNNNDRVSSSSKKPPGFHLDPELENDFSETYDALPPPDAEMPEGTSSEDSTTRPLGRAASFPAGGGRRPPADAGGNVTAEKRYDNAKAPVNVALPPSPRRSAAANERVAQRQRPWTPTRDHHLHHRTASSSPLSPKSGTPRRQFGQHANSNQSESLSATTPRHHRSPERSVADLLLWERERLAKIDAVREKLLTEREAADSEALRALQANAPALSPGSRRLIAAASDRRLTAVDHAVMTGSAMKKEALLHRQKLQELQQRRSPQRNVVQRGVSKKDNGTDRGRLDVMVKAKAAATAPPTGTPTASLHAFHQHEQVHDETLSWWMSAVRSDSSYIRNGHALLSHHR